MVKKNIYIGIGILSIILFYLPVFILPKDPLLEITHEDGLIEYFSVVFFFLAALVFLWIFITKNRSIFFLFFILAFLFAAGEEMSWGQRIFHFKVPEAITSINAQGEFNIHNLDFIQHEHGLNLSLKALLNFNRMFILFYLVYCVFIPLAYRYSGKVRGLANRIRLPIVSFWIGLLFLANEITSKAIELIYVARLPYDLDIAEIKETYWALAVFIMAIYFLSIAVPKEKVRLIHSPAH